MRRAFEENKMTQDEQFLSNPIEAISIQFGIKMPEEVKDEKPDENKEKKVEINLIIAISGPVEFRMSPSVLNALHQFNYRCDMSYLVKDLKQYRPKLRPLTNCPPNMLKNRPLKRKRRLVVRDWFFYAVWYIRLQRIIDGITKNEMEKFNAPLNESDIDSASYY